MATIVCIFSFVPHRNAQLRRAAERDLILGNEREIPVVFIFTIVLVRITQPHRMRSRIRLSVLVTLIVINLPRITRAVVGDLDMQVLLD